MYRYYTIQGDHNSDRGDDDDDDDTYFNRDTIQDSALLFPLSSFLINFDKLY